MKIKSITTETDGNGEHKVIEQTNGIKIRLLKVPSESYKEKMRIRAEAEAEKQAARKIIDDKERMIKERMRKIARDQLIAEGEDV